MNTFKEDLQFGKKYEILFMQYIQYDDYKFSKGLNKHYDIKIILNNCRIKYEIKADRLAYKTGNIAIEYMCNHQPSGITATRSKYYGIFIIKDDDTYDLYIIPTKIIKQLIMDKLYWKDIGGGYDYRAQLYLFKTDIFKDYKHRVE
jgi:hypothetical protein